MAPVRHAEKSYVERGDRIILPPRFLQVRDVDNAQSFASVRGFLSSNVSICAKLMFVLRDSLGHAKLGEPTCGNR